MSRSLQKLGKFLLLILSLYFLELEIVDKSMSHSLANSILANFEFFFWVTVAVRKPETEKFVRVYCWFTIASMTAEA